MKSLTVSERIDAPVDRVFASLTDLASMPDVVSGVDRVDLLTDGPMQVGTRWRESRTFFGKEATEEMEISEFVLNSHYTSLAESHGSHYRSTCRFVPQGESTDVTMEFAATPVSLLAKLMTPLFGFMAKSLVKCMQEDLADWKRAIESESENEPGGSSA